MIQFPNAKINLGLNIVSRREDGYHNLETIFIPIPLCDVLEVVESDKGVSGDIDLQLYGMEKESKLNLVEIAYHKIADRYNLPPVDAYLKKIIPFAAGLGGGSADAAFMLTMLNAEFKLNIPKEELKQIAAQIGADCPFFIENTPMYATGTGVELSPIELNLSGYYILLVKPKLAISTAEAYAGVTPKSPQINILDAVKAPVDSWRDTIKNDFEESLFPKYSKLKEIKDELYGEGAVYASMSGSGSTMYGLFTSNPAGIAGKFGGDDIECVHTLEL